MTKEAPVDFSRVLNIEPIDESKTQYKTVRLDINGVSKDVLVPLPNVKTNYPVIVKSKKNVDVMCQLDNGQGISPNTVETSVASGTKNIQWIFHELDEQVCEKLGSSSESDGGKIRNMINELRTQVVNEIQSPSNQNILPNPKPKIRSNVSDNVIVIAPDSRSNTISDVLVQDPKSNKPPKAPVRIIRLGDNNTSTTNSRQQSSVRMPQSHITPIRGLPSGNTLSQQILRNSQIGKSSGYGLSQRVESNKGTLKANVNPTSDTPTLNLDIAKGTEIPGFLGSDGKFYVQLNTESMKLYNPKSQSTFKPVDPKMTNMQNCVLPQHISTSVSGNSYVLLQPPQLNSNVVATSLADGGLNRSVISSGSLLTSNLTNTMPNSSSTGAVMSQGGRHVASSGFSKEKRILGPMMQNTQQPFIPLTSITSKGAEHTLNSVNDDNPSLKLRIDSVYSLPPQTGAPHTSTAPLLDEVHSVMKSESLPKGLLDTIFDDVMQRTSDKSGGVDEGNGLLSKSTTCGLVLSKGETAVSHKAGHIRNTARKSFLSKSTTRGLVLSKGESAVSHKAGHIRNTARKSFRRHFLDNTKNKHNKRVHVQDNTQVQFKENPFLRVMVENLDLGPRFHGCQASRLKQHLKYRRRIKSISAKRKLNKKTKKSEGNDNAKKSPGNVSKDTVDLTKSCPNPQPSSVEEIVRDTTKATSKMLLITTSGARYIMPMVPGLTTEVFVKALKDGSIKLPNASKENSIQVEKPAVFSPIHSTAQSTITTPSAGSKILSIGNSGPKIPNLVNIGIVQNNVDKPVLSDVIPLKNTNAPIMRSLMNTGNSVSCGKSNSQQLHNIPGIHRQPTYTLVIPSKQHVSSSPVNTNVMSSQSIMNKSPVSTQMEPMETTKLKPSERILLPRKRMIQQGIDTPNIKQNKISDALGIISSVVPPDEQSSELGGDAADAPPPKESSSSDRIKLLRDKLKEQEAALAKARKQREDTTKILDEMD